MHEPPGGAAPRPLTTDPRRTRRDGAVVPHALALAAILLIALNLRPGATTLGPVLQEVSASLGLTGGTAGLLAALPGLCFGAVGFVAVRVAARMGLSAAVLGGAALVVVGLAARALAGSTGPFLVFTLFALAGMALGNVLVPAWIKLHSARRGVLYMTVYSVVLTAGGSLGALVTAPLAAAGGAEGWRRALGAWAVVALAPVAAWVLVVRRTGRDFPAVDDGRSRGPSLLRSPSAIALTVVFGLQSMNAYVQFAWLPQVLRDAGLAAGTSGSVVAVISACGVLGSLLMPTVISRSRSLVPWIVAFGLVTAVGYLGLLIAPVAGAWVWALILGLGGFAFPTVLALLPALSRDPHVTARLSGFVQPLGYVLAAIGPFVVGLVHQATGGWTVALVLMAGSGVLMALTGLRVSGRTLVDDELAAARR
ncbi:MFS transporter [Micrococcus yunnanensis]|uniref:MFS transporter n=1 Tax=Micrococcus yunnanensis TaxID=566027 RepID=UPI001071E346|nr:MFS transporter [Micrococcus yunnanensis]MBF0745425.1 MFS transporter [Micrococcus yunnanensis]TFU54384.1 MFS transporter [Micrococcus yunnanensis]